MIVRFQNLFLFFFLGGSLFGTVSAQETSVAPERIMRSPDTSREKPRPTPTPLPENKILCLVDGRRLTQAMVDRILDKLLEGREGPQDHHLDRLRLVYTQNIMQEWLERNLLAAEAEAEEITITAEEVLEQEKALKQAARVSFEIDGALEKIGESKEEYRRQLHEALLGEKLVKRRISAYFTEDDLRNIYKQNPTAFQRPPRVRAVHIFCPLKKDVSKEEKEKRREFMHEARDRARDGEDLAKIAREADPAFSVLGGGLGWLYPTNRLPPPINSLVFKLRVGKLGKVVETDYGYYLVRVEEKQPLFGRTYEEAREAVFDAVFDGVRKKVLELAKRAHKVHINISGIPEDKM